MQINTIDLDFKDASRCESAPDVDACIVMYVGSNGKIQYTTYGHWQHGILYVPGWWVCWEVGQSEVYTVTGEWKE